MGRGLGPGARQAASRPLRASPCLSPCPPLCLWPAAVPTVPSGSSSTCAVTFRCPGRAFLKGHGEGRPERSTEARTVRAPRRGQEPEQARCRPPGARGLPVQLQTLLSFWEPAHRDRPKHPGSDAGPATSPRPGGGEGGAVPPAPAAPSHLPKLYTVHVSAPDILLSNCLASSSEKRPSLLKNDLSSSSRKITLSSLEERKVLYLQQHVSCPRPPSTLSCDRHPRHTCSVPGGQVTGTETKEIRPTRPAWSSCRQTARSGRGCYRHGGSWQPGKVSSWAASKAPLQAPLPL